MWLFSKKVKKEKLPKFRLVEYYHVLDNLYSYRIEELKTQLFMSGVSYDEYCPISNWPTDDGIMRSKNLAEERFKKICKAGGILTKQVIAVSDIVGGNDE